MTRDDIILMADASGLSYYGMGKDREKFIHYLEAFANLVAKHERKACAIVAENKEAWYDDSRGIAKAIRARGDTK